MMASVRMDMGLAWLAINAVQRDNLPKSRAVKSSELKATRN
jgi:hypothetical protein